MKILLKYLPAMVLASASSFFAYDIITDISGGGDSHLHVFIEFSVAIILFRELQHVSQLSLAIREEKSKNARLAGELRPSFVSN